MPTISPAPSTLGLASPAIGPWFYDDSDNPPILSIPLPDGDLGCSITLADKMKWSAPAGGTVSWLIAGAPMLANLRNANGEGAFADGALVVLFTLLPEVAERLAALTSIVPRPEGGGLPGALTPARPVLKYLALEIKDASLTLADKLNLFGRGFPADITTDGDRASYLGLSIAGGELANNANPVTILARPGKDDRVILQNRLNKSLAVKMRAFDRRGRALDPGAIAVMLNWMAQTAQWENLYFSNETKERRTADAAAGRIVHIVSPHEGPLSAEIAARLQTSGMTVQGGNSSLFAVGANPSISLSAAADANTDSVPVPRLAPLPLGPYAALASATPFAGWTNTTTPHPLPRDFLPVAIVDVEAHLTGQLRTGADNPQADPKRRISALPNTASTVFHSTIDAATKAALASLTGQGMLMAAELDADWGVQEVPANIGTDPLTNVTPETCTFTVRAIAGAGSAVGNTAAGQVVAVYFDNLPAGTWVRIWPHGMDTETGRRFRQTGAAGLVNASGKALLALPLPDGTAGKADGTVKMTFDLLLVTHVADKVLTNLPFPRPVLVAGTALALPADGSMPAGVQLFVPERGDTILRHAGQLQSGQTLLAITGDLASGTVQRVDPATIQAADRHTDTLPNAAAAGDVLVSTVPAFGQTPEGSLPETGGAWSRVHRTRIGSPLAIGTPAPSVERAELMAFTPGSGLIGSAPARGRWHEAPPARLGHPGVSAADEVHGEGVSLAGPAADALRPLADERAAADLAGFIGRAGVPFTPATVQEGASVWSSVLETLPTHMAGGAVFRALLTLAPTFQPGQSWSAIKAKIDDALSSLGLGSVDSMVDTSTFDDDALAAAADRLLWKTRKGQTHFALSLLAAIDRAEDMIYLQTPVIDIQTAGGGQINLVDRIIQRMAARPALQVVLCVPEGWLPDRTAKLDAIRKSSVQAVLKRLMDAGQTRVVLFSPNAGIGRKLYMASTTAVVDDVFLISGSAHLWRRGLTFDSALSVAIFDDHLTDGRSALVSSQRTLLMEQMLGLRAGLLPYGAQECVAALKALESGGGFGRTAPGAFAAAVDTISDADHMIWNPDGTQADQWATWLAGLTGAARDEVNNAIR